MVSPFQPVVGVQGKRSSDSGTRDTTAPRFLVPQSELRKKRILHVEFDRVLLATRHALLETAGFEVISCFSGMAAREVSTGSAHFDLFLIGHAAPIDERTDLVTWIRAHFPRVAIVALRSRDTDYSPLGGDATAVADPAVLLNTVIDLLRVR